MSGPSGFHAQPRLPDQTDIGAFLDGLDERILEVGGRIYFAKDSRAKVHHIPEMYPQHGEWRTIRAKADLNGVLISDVARRLELFPGLDGMEVDSRPKASGCNRTWVADRG